MTSVAVSSFNFFFPANGRRSPRMWQPEAAKFGLAQKPRFHPIATHAPTLGKAHKLSKNPSAKMGSLLRLHSRSTLNGVLMWPPVHVT